jgi:hypothetical protein
MYDLQLKLYLSKKNKLKCFFPSEKVYSASKKNNVLSISLFDRVKSIEKFASRAIDCKIKHEFVSCSISFTVTSYPKK